MIERSIPYVRGDYEGTHEADLAILSFIYKQVSLAGVIPITQPANLDAQTFVDGLGKV